MLADGSAVMELFTDIGDYGYTVKDFTSALSGITSPSITFRINSYGGEVIEALAIYDLIRASEKNFTAEVFGMCGSAATLIALACERVELAENATWLVHEMKCGVYCTVADFDKMRETMETLRDKVYGIYEAKTGKDRATLEETCSFDHYMSAQEALEYGFIDGILDGTISAEDRDHYLQIVSDEVKRLSRLVVSMLNISKMHAGELQINPSRFDLTRQIVNIFIGFEQKINIKKINIIGMDSLSKVCVVADPDMINQVFYNIIDNAVKFTQPGGDIVVSMSIQENNVIVCVRNTGNVIKDEDLDHVFERFYKGDKSRSLDSKSAGLGLFIVKSIVELHGGKISVSNIDNKYTQFSVSLKMNIRED